MRIHLFAIRCPGCGSTNTTRIRGAGFEYYECNACGYQWFWLARHFLKGARR